MDKHRAVHLYGDSNVVPQLVLCVLPNEVQLSRLAHALWDDNVSHWRTDFQTYGVLELGGQQASSSR